MMGDVIVTREAYDLYKTKLTDEYAAEHNIKYPAHKKCSLKHKVRL